jgi:hypothetical protein
MFQKAWEDSDRKVAVHQMGGGGCKRQSTKKAGTRGPYYRRTRPQGVETDDFEASLGGIENRAAGPLRDLIVGRSITVERKGAVGQLIAAQMMRGPAFFKAHDELMEEVFDGMGPKTFARAIWRPLGVMSNVLVSGCEPSTGTGRIGWPRCSHTQ